MQKKTKLNLILTLLLGALATTFTYNSNTLAMEENEINDLHGTNEINTNTVQNAQTQTDPEQNSFINKKTKNSINEINTNTVQNAQTQTDPEQNSFINKKTKNSINEINTNTVQNAQTQTDPEQNSFINQKTKNSINEINTNTVQNAQAQTDPEQNSFINKKTKNSINEINTNTVQNAQAELNSIKNTNNENNPFSKSYMPKKISQHINTDKNKNKFCLKKPLDQTELSRIMFHYSKLNNTNLLESICEFSKTTKDYITEEKRKYDDQMYDLIKKTVRFFDSNQIETNNGNLTDIKQFWENLEKESYKSQYDLWYSIICNDVHDENLIYIEYSFPEPTKTPAKFFNLLPYELEKDIDVEKYYDDPNDHMISFLNNASHSSFLSNIFTINDDLFVRTLENLFIQTKNCNENYKNIYDFLKYRRFDFFDNTESFFKFLNTGGKVRIIVGSLLTTKTDIACDIFPNEYVGQKYCSTIEVDKDSIKVSVNFPKNNFVRKFEVPTSENANFSLDVNSTSEKEVFESKFDTYKNLIYTKTKYNSSQNDDNLTTFIEYYFPKKIKAPLHLLPENIKRNIDKNKYENDPNEYMISYLNNSATAKTDIRKNIYQDDRIKAKSKYYSKSTQIMRYNNLLSDLRPHKTKTSIQPFCHACATECYEIIQNFLKNCDFNVFYESDDFLNFLEKGGKVKICISSFFDKETGHLYKKILSGNNFPKDINKIFFCSTIEIDKDLTTINIEIPQNNVSKKFEWITNTKGDF